MRIRKVKKVGGSCDIRLKSADLEDFDLKDGDDVDISEIAKVDKVDFMGEED